MGKKTFSKMNKMLTNSHISIQCRKRAVKTYIWSGLLYGSEAWTINKDSQRKLEAMEMWCWRRVLKIPWTAMKTNEEVLQRIGSQRELMNHIRGRQMEFLGHVMRREALENLAITGRIEGKRSRGRQREKFIDGILREI